MCEMEVGTVRGGRDVVVCNVRGKRTCTLHEVHSIYLSVKVL